MFRVAGLVDFKESSARGAADGGGERGAGVVDVGASAVVREHADELSVVVGYHLANSLQL